jgi:acetyl esterase
VKNIVALAVAGVASAVLASSVVSPPPAASAPRAVAASTTVAPKATPSKVIRTSATETVADFAYPSDGTTQYLQATWDNDVTPADAPWVMLIHGGSWGWWSMPGRQGMGTATAPLRAAGFVVFSIDYRPSSEAVWPAQSHDPANAIIWIKAHAAQFGIGAGRGAVYGFSAGAQMATHMGLVGAGDGRTNAVVAVSPPAQPYLQWLAGYGKYSTITPNETMRKIGDSAEDLVGCPASTYRTDPACQARYDRSYAATYASGAEDAPLFLVHATDDTAVPVNHSYWLNDAVVKSGGSSTLVRPSTGGHSQAILWGNPTLTARVISFLKENTK